MAGDNYKPKVMDGITVQDLGDEVMLYDSGRENVHVLNHTASAIWYLCDGNHTIEEIRKHLEEKFPEVPGSDLIDDIIATIDKLKQRNLVV